MKKIIFYDCEICGARYGGKDADDLEAKAAAAECEARGYGEKYPIGCIYGDHSEDAFYKNITFAVATNEVDNEVGHKARIYSHLNRGGSWACRENSADSLDDSLCGGTSLDLKNFSGKDLDRNHPTFKRMVAYLKSKNIPITIWDGQKAVPYEDED